MKIGRTALLVAVLVAASPAVAADTLAIDNGADLKWVNYTGKVYFRSLDTADLGWLGCCYNHYIDPTTDEGKAVSSAFPSKGLPAQPLISPPASRAQAGPVLQLGNG